MQQTARAIVAACVVVVPVVDVAHVLIALAAVLVVAAAVVAHVLVAALVAAAAAAAAVAAAVVLVALAVVGPLGAQMNQQCGVLVQTPTAPKMTLQSPPLVHLMEMQHLQTGNTSHQVCLTLRG